ncbi:MAG: hypothetical protein R3B72_11065 [Polyangiaceae bacterium]
MTSARLVSFPRPREEDFEDVHWALSAANTLWDRGERKEALKWLRRAAGAAAGRDADIRAVELYKAAADVASLVEAEAQKAGEEPTPRTAGRARVNRVNAPPATRTRPGPPRPRASAAPPKAPAPSPSGAAPPKSRGREARPPSREPADLSPKVPPKTRISERFGAFELPFDDSEEETFIRPDTMIRRALMAIDPDYARRTEYRPEDDEDDDDDDEAPDSGSEAPDSARPPRAAWGWDEPPPRGKSWGWDDDEPARASSWGWGEDDEVAGSSRWSEPDEEEADTGRIDEHEEQAETVRRSRKELPLAKRADGPSAPPTAEDRPKPKAVEPNHTAGPMPGGLLTLRVALLPIPEEGDVRIIFLSPDEDPPPGIATALLVPPSEEDARLIAALYGDSAAKL